jgi:hypothetical protein
MLDALGIGLDVAEHHRAGRLAPESVPDAHDLQPVIGQRLSPGQLLADAIDQDFTAAAGFTSNTPAGGGSDGRAAMELSASVAQEWRR